jgi:glycosyltransferase involved in cell wall biosynthesis
VISLITTTIDEALIDISKLLRSLEIQKYRDIEVIFLNQTKNSLNYEECPFQLHELFIPRTSLSHARNIGLDAAQGTIFGFPDDDCYYHVDTLLNVVKVLRNEKFSFLYANQFDPVTTESRQNMRFEDQEVIDVTNPKSSNSNTIFVKRSAIHSLQFDQQMGVGAKYGSSEESDLLFRMIKRGARGVFASSVKVYHPFFDQYESTPSHKAYHYSLGLVHLWYKHRHFLGCQRLLWVLYFKPIIGLFLAILLLDYHKTRVRFHKWRAILAYTVKMIVLR